MTPAPESYCEGIRSYCKKAYKKCFRSPHMHLPYPFLVPGSCYDNQLWDWDSWTNFMPLWAGVATREQAERMVRRLTDPATFWAPYGVRTLSKLEKMYSTAQTGNPSCWLGPIWGISNYMVWSGLLRYRFTAEANELAVKTVTLFGRDILSCGEMHEYYEPETGSGISNQGFQSWNFLAFRVARWLREKS